MRLLVRGGFMEIYNGADKLVFRDVAADAVEDLSAAGIVLRLPDGAAGVDYDDARHYVTFYDPDGAVFVVQGEPDIAGLADFIVNLPYLLAQQTVRVTLRNAETVYTRNARAAKERSLASELDALPEAERSVVSKLLKLIKG